MIASLLFALALAADAPQAPPPSSDVVQAPPRAIAPGVTLIPDGSYAGRGPDGASVLFQTPQGLVVMDTGRHVQHSDAILAFADAQRLPIIAIVNSHWHLDHTSGNIRIKAAFPNAPVYATNAVDGAITGFLAENLAGAQASLPSLTGVDAQEARIFIDTMAHAASLRPDVVVTRSGRMRIGAKVFDVHVTDHAVTDADIWLYDRSSHVAAIGDLVTLPAPYFETACSNRWREALDEVWATPFRVAIPGHGEPMSRDQFKLYRAAFGAFVDCVHSDNQASACASAWVRAVTPLIGTDAAIGARAGRMAAYYVAFLRRQGGNGQGCQKP